MFHNNTTFNRPQNLMSISLNASATNKAETATDLKDDTFKVPMPRRPTPIINQNRRSVITYLDQHQD